MARLFVVLGVLLCSFASIVYGVALSDILTIQKGTTNGGCDSRMGILDGPDSGWLQDAIDSLDVTLNAIDQYNDDTDTGARVRDAMAVFFKIPASIPKSKGLKATVQAIYNNIEYVQTWLNGDPRSGKAKDEVILFCGSDFLVQKAPTDTAQDYLGKNIQVDGKDLPINKVDALSKRLTGGNVPWWSGDHAEFNGYYFAPATSGANYCTDETYGLTATLTELEKPAEGGQPVIRRNINNVVLCPYAFDKPNFPNLYIDAFPLISAGTNLADVTPLSTTLVHEAFHVILGTGFLEGKAEQYGLAECTNLAQINQGNARKNPENYVFFISAMYYLTAPTANPPTNETPLGQNWDFTDGPDKAKDPNAMDTS